MILGRFSLMLLGAIFLMSQSAYANSIQFDPKVSVELKAQVNGDLEFLQSLQGDKSSPLHAQIFGAVDGANYLNWFVSRVFQFGVDEETSDATVAYFTKKFPNKIFVAKTYIENGFPQVARVMTLIHEARHTEEENNHWKHALCGPFFKSKSIWTHKGLALHFACDHTELGSYATGAILLHHVSKFCTTCTAKVKEDAQIYSDDQILRITNEDARAKLDADFLFE